MTASDPASPDTRADRRLLDTFVRDCQVLVGQVPFVGAPAVFSQFRALVHETPSPKSIFAQALMEHFVLQFTLRLLPRVDPHGESPSATLELLKEISPQDEPQRSLDMDISTTRGDLHVVSAEVTEPMSRKRHRAVESAVAFIRRHFADSGLRLGRVAGYVRLSPSHLDRLLTKQSGTSFVGHLRQARLHRASELLEHTGLSIKEIAAEVGYDRVSTFDRNFKQIYACSPRAWRVCLQGARQETITKSKIREYKSVDSSTSDV
jgi:AraC-like DNA-binding protein